ncbi:MAG: hypothetical protein VR65_15840 [Desulfobulbaceae bacterium BRH_c16a]|nr:MAG: hypothetical protein VR65_15840 [Desulfobulbaceae bacterium BRH_c16a]
MLKTENGKNGVLSALFIEKENCLPNHSASSGHRRIAKKINYTRNSENTPINSQKPARIPHNPAHPGTARHFSRLMNSENNGIIPGFADITDQSRKHTKILF